MTRFVEWLLDLDSIRLGRDAPLSLQWQSHPEAWMLLCFALLAVFVVGLIYRRERVGPRRRVGLAVLRCLLIALVAAVLCQPALVLQRNRVLPSHVALLVDTSHSMATRELYTDESLAASVCIGAGLADPTELPDHSRIELATAALTTRLHRLETGATPPLRQLLEQNAVQLYTFAGLAEAKAFAASKEALPAVVDALRAVHADGTSTNLGGALTRVIEQAQGRRLAAIVLVSDGRSTGTSRVDASPTSLPDAIDLARQSSVPIFPLLIGSPTEPVDLEVGPLRAQENVFVDDLLAIEAELTARGLTEQIRVEVSLVEQRSGLAVASEDVLFDSPGGSATVELSTKPERAGDARYRVEVAALANEGNTRNNADHIDVSILEDHINVLYVESYPRYEYRYLKNALMREKTMRASVLLLDADEHFVQEGTDPIRRFPATPEELNRYDVVLFGDVDPQAGWLTPAQMDLLVDFVSRRGGGFGLIAGQRSAPQRFRGTPLEKLIPVQIDPEFVGRYESSLTSGYRPMLTPEGRRSRIFRFTRDRSQSKSMFEALPELYWTARTLGPKPGATVLAEHPTMEAISGSMPLFVTGQYGAGKLFFQATDDTWRWRRHRGELLHDAYWVQVARELMQPAHIARDRRFVIRTDRRVYRYGQPARTQVEIFDSDLLGQQGDTIALVANDQQGFAVAHFAAHALGPESNVFEASFVPPGPGRFAIQAERIASPAGERPPTAVIQVEKPDLESRRVQADHQVLHRLAEATGGEVVSLDDLSGGFARIRNRSIQVPDDVIEPLWDSKLALLLFALLISTEWVLRKALGML